MKNETIPLVVIFRPDSISGRDNITSSKHLTRKLGGFLTQVGLTHEILRPASLAEATEMAIQASRTCRIVAAAGGDGTINAVAKGLAGSECCLGVLPLGSGNDTARGLGIPQRLPDAVRLLKSAQKLLSSGDTIKHTHFADITAAPDDATRPESARIPRILPGSIIQKMDAGYVSYYDSSDRMSAGPASSLNQSFFINTLGTGFDGKVAWNASKTRFPGGKLKYPVGVLKSLFTYKACVMTVTADAETIRDRFLMATVANGPFEGGGIPIAPSADHRDGFFQLVLIRDIGRMARIPLLIKVLLHGASEGSGIIIKKCSSISIDCDRPQMVHTDGEVISTTVVKLKADIHPGLLNIICGSPIAARTGWHR